MESKADPRHREPQPSDLNQEILEWHFVVDIEASDSKLVSLPSGLHFFVREARPWRLGFKCFGSLVVLHIYQILQHDGTTFCSVAKEDEHVKGLL